MRHFNFNWRLRLAILSLGFALAWAPSHFLYACSVCGCGDPLMAAGTAPPMAGIMRLALDAEYLYATAEGDDPGTTEYLTQETLRPVLVYNASNSLALVLQVPLVRKNWWTNDPNDEANLGYMNTTNYGFGDIELGGRWFFWRDTHLVEHWAQNAAVSLGSSLNTGNSNIYEDGQLIDQHAQLGTGAIGPYLGFLYDYNRDRWGLNANMTYRYRATNYQGYQFGQALGFGAGGNYKLSESLNLTLSLDGRYADYDVDWAAGQNDPDTGGTVLDLTPGLGWQMNSFLAFSGRVQCPIYSNLFGVQAVTPTVDCSIQYLYSL